MTSKKPRPQLTLLRGLIAQPPMKENDDMTTIALTDGTVISAYEQLDSLDQALAGFLLKYPNAHTFREYRRDLLQYLSWCAQQTPPVRPLEAKRFHVEGYLRWLEGRGLAEATISRRFGTIRVFYDYLALEEFIDKDPSRAVKRPPVDREKQKRTWLNAVQWAQLLTAAREESPTAHALVALLGMRGLRVHEACLLDIQTHLSQDSGYDILTFTGKGNKAARVVLAPPVAVAVRQCIGDRQIGPVLLNARGRRMDRGAADRLLQKCAVKGALVADFSPHSLRRTAITLALGQGQSLYDVQTFARHSDPKTTQLYDMHAKQIDRNSGAAIASFMSAIAG